MTKRQSREIRSSITVVYKKCYSPCSLEVCLLFLNIKELKILNEIIENIGISHWVKMGIMEYQLNIKPELTNG